MKPAEFWIGLGSIVLAASSCSGSDDDLGFETGPLMRPGDDCLRCHSADSDYPQAPHWTLAGTVFPTLDARSDAGLSEARVLVSSNQGEQLFALTTNQVGNFYTDTPVPQGFRVAVEYQGQRIEMPCPPPAGNCGACHSLPPIGGPQGRITVAQGAPQLEGSFDCDEWTRKLPNSTE